MEFSFSSKVEKISEFYKSMGQKISKKYYDIMM